MIRALVPALLLAGCTSWELVSPIGIAEHGGVRQVFGGGANAFVVPLHDGALVVDTKLSASVQDLEAHLDAHGLVPRWIAITHAHTDHAEGLPRIVAKGDASTAVVAAAPVVSGWNSHAPKNAHGVDPAAPEDLEGHVGEPVKLYAFAHAHTGGDLAVWLPERGVLLTGDLFSCGYVHHAERGDGGSWTGLTAAIETLVALRPTHVIGGHGPGCGLADFEEYLRFLHALTSDTPERPDYREYWILGKRISNIDDAIACARSEKAAGPWSELATFASNCDGLCLTAQPAPCPR